MFCDRSPFGPPGGGAVCLLCGLSSFAYSTVTGVHRCVRGYVRMSVSVHTWALVHACVGAYMWAHVLRHWHRAQPSLHPTLRTPVLGPCSASKCVFDEPRDPSPTREEAVPWLPTQVFADGAAGDAACQLSSAPGGCVLLPVLLLLRTAQHGSVAPCFSDRGRHRSLAGLFMRSLTRSELSRLSGSHVLDPCQALAGPQ